MTETVVNTRTLPVFLAELIPTETLRIARVGREIRLIPVEEVQDVPMQAEETADFRHESEPPKSAMGILQQYAKPINPPNLADGADDLTEWEILQLENIQTNTPTEPPKFTIGMLQKYANPALIPLEKEAWGMAVMEKYGGQQ